MNDPRFNRELFRGYWDYYRKYYGAEYRTGQGLDEITDTIARYSRDGTWVDLGGGTSSIIWLPAFRHIEQVFVLDKYREAFYVQETVRKEAPSGCYQHVLNRYGKLYDAVCEIPITFILADLLGEIDATLKCDNVTQFGLLGLCTSKTQYYKQLDRLTSFMNSGAIFIGANWVLSKGYQSERQLDNTYIKAGLIEDWARSRGRKLLEEKLIHIQNDKNYDAVLIYAFS